MVRHRLQNGKTLTESSSSVGVTSPARSVVPVVPITLVLALVSVLLVELISQQTDRTFTTTLSTRSTPWVLCLLLSYGSRTTLPVPIVGLAAGLTATLLTPHVAHGRHVCRHKVPKAHEVIHDVHLEPPHIIRKRSIDQPLRIYLHYDKSVSMLPSKKYRDLLKESEVAFLPTPTPVSKIFLSPTPVTQNYSDSTTPSIKPSAHEIPCQYNRYFNYLDREKTILPEAIRYWQDTLRVRATRVPIRLRRKCQSTKVVYKDQMQYCVGKCAEKTICGDITIPEEHLETCYCVDCDGEGYQQRGAKGPGVNNTDFILYVAALSSERCHHGNTIAYAAYCQQERSLDRPVAGYFSICPNSLSTSPQLLSTIKHEILHALGFTAGLYAFYRDREGNPLTNRLEVSNHPPYNSTLQLYQPSERVIRRVERPNWLLQSGHENHSVWMIVTPRVVEEVRRHFNCSTLEGAELEDQLINGKTLADGVIDGTAFTHWEKRVFENEAMTGTYTQNPVISRITLALMEDTGWYSVNYDNAAEYEWGKNLGCDFVKNSCYGWIVTKSKRNESIHPFCDQVKWGQLRTDCTNNRHSVAVCNLVQHKSPLPERYQYFSELAGVSSADVKRFGGSVDLADHCPYLQELLWKSGDSSIRGSRCTREENNLENRYNYFLENYGNSSRCFNHDGMWHLQHCSQSVLTQHMGSGCYKYECSPEEGLVIVIESKRYKCHKEGQRISIVHDSKRLRHQGLIICPACEEVCQEVGVNCPPDEANAPEVQVNSYQVMPPLTCCGAFLGASLFLYKWHMLFQVLTALVLTGILSPIDKGIFGLT